MKMKLLAAALLAAAPSVFAADNNCPATPKEKWLRAEEIQLRLESRGYEVRRIKREGGCFEVYAKKDGKRVDAYVSPADGAIVKEKVKPS